jgi:hypothetical protein
LRTFTPLMIAAMMMIKNVIGAPIPNIFPPPLSHEARYCNRFTLRLMPS